METGGYKNRSRSMPKAELHALIKERLGVPCENIICEYGMSELSSQAYDFRRRDPHPPQSRAFSIFRRGRACKSFRRKPAAKSPMAKPV
jgi:hypothetical protein